MLVGGCCHFPEKKSTYQHLVFDHPSNLVSNCSDHCDIADYHYEAPFDNGYRTYLYFVIEICLDMNESVVLWPLIY